MRLAATLLLAAICALLQLSATAISADANNSSSNTQTSSVSNNALADSKQQSKLATTNAPMNLANETSTDDSIYVPVPIAAPIDVGFGDSSVASGAAPDLIQTTQLQQSSAALDDADEASDAPSQVPQQQQVAVDDSSASGDTSKSVAKGPGNSPWAGNWPKKFQIGYIKQSDLHQVLVESLKADPFPVSKLSAQAGTANKQAPAQAAISVPLPPTQLKSKRDSYKNTNNAQSQRLVTFDDKPNFGVFQQQSGLYHPLQVQQTFKQPSNGNNNNFYFSNSNSPQLAKLMHQPMFRIENNKYFTQSRFPSQAQAPSQAYFGGMSAFVVQNQMPLAATRNFNNQFAHNLRAQQAYHAPSSPQRPFGNSEGQYPVNVRFPTRSKQPIYTFNNYQQQAQSDLNSMNLNLASLGNSQQSLQQQHAQQQQQLARPLAQTSMLLSSSRPLKGGHAASKYSPWKPLEANSQQQQVDQQLKQSDFADDAPLEATKTSSMNAGVQDSSDDSDYGFGSAKDPTPASGLTNVHPMINNYYTNATSRFSGAAKSSSTGRSAPKSANNATDASINTLKSPMNVARRLNTTTATGQRKGGPEITTTQAPDTTQSTVSGTMPTFTTTMQSIVGETTEPESESVPETSSDQDSSKTTTTSMSTPTVGTRNAESPTTQQPAEAPTSTIGAPKSASDSPSTDSPSPDSTQQPSGEQTTTTTVASTTSTEVSTSSEDDESAAVVTAVSTLSRAERERESQPLSLTAVQLNRKKARSSERLVAGTKSGLKVKQASSGKLSSNATASNGAASSKKAKNGKRNKSSDARNLRLPVSATGNKKSAKLTQVQQPASPLQPAQFASMSPAQAQSTAQTLASLLLARCMSSTSCAHLLDVCATKQGAFQLPSETTAAAAAGAIESASNATGSRAKWAMPVGLASSSVLALAQALDADKALRMFAAWKDAVDNTLDFTGELGYTLLLPSNEALDRVPQSTLDGWLQNGDQLDALIAAHILDSVEPLDVTKSTRLLKARGLHFSQIRDKTWTINGKRVVYANQAAPGKFSLNEACCVMSSALSSQLARTAFAAPVYKCLRLFDCFGVRSDESRSEIGFLYDIYFISCRKAISESNEKQANSPSNEQAQKLCCQLRAFLLLLSSKTNFSNCN